MFSKFKMCHTNDIFKVGESQLRLILDNNKDVFAIQLCEITLVPESKFKQMQDELQSCEKIKKILQIKNPKPNPKPNQYIADEFNFGMAPFSISFNRKKKDMDVYEMQFGGVVLIPQTRFNWMMNELQKYDEIEKEMEKEKENAPKTM